MGDSQMYGALPPQDEMLDIAHVHEEHEAPSRVSRSALLGMVRECLGFSINRIINQQFLSRHRAFEVFAHTRHYYSSMSPVKVDPRIHHTLLFLTMDPPPFTVSDIQAGFAGLFAVVGASMRAPSPSR